MKFYQLLLIDPIVKKILMNEVKVSMRNIMNFKKWILKENKLTYKNKKMPRKLLLL